MRTVISLFHLYMESKQVCFKTRFNAGNYDALYDLKSGYVNFFEMVAITFFDMMRAGFNPDEVIPFLYGYFHVVRCPRAFMGIIVKENWQTHIFIVFTLIT